MQIKVSQHWRSVDPRYAQPVVEVVAISEPFQKQVRSNSLSPKHVTIRDVTIRNLESGRQTVAMDARFNGKRGGYELVKDIQP